MKIADREPTWFDVRRASLGRPVLAHGRYGRAMRALWCHRTDKPSERKLNVIAAIDRWIRRSIDQPHGDRKLRFRRRTPSASGAASG